MSETNTKPIRTIAFMMGATMLSKVLGLVREMMLASAYGAGNAVAEAFSGALSVPSTFFDILFSAAILGCFIPVYNSFKGNTKEADDFAGLFFNIISLLTGVLALAGILFAEPLINLVTPGLEDPALAVTIVRILFPMIIFTGMAYTLVGVMQSKGRFLLPALISSISNLGVILYFLFLNRYFDIYGLAVAYVLSWLIQFLTLAVPLVKNGFRFRAVLTFKNPYLRTALRMVPPIMIGSWLSPMTILIGKHFSSYFNGVATFNYANQTYIMIAGILVYSICNYVFPALSRLADEGNELQFISTIHSGVKCVMFLIIPCMFAVMVLGREIVSILYLRGEYTAQNAYDTAMALQIISIAMPAYGILEIGNRVFYAEKKTLYPMLASGVGVVVLLVLSAVCVRGFSMGLASVAAAVAASQAAGALLLTIAIVKKNKGLLTLSFGLDIIKMVGSGLISFALMTLVYRWLDNRPFETGVLHNITVCLITFLCGGIVYLLSVKITKVKITFKKGKEAA
ncbi:MAG: murein biosynthesis integral membrane protein MurJ [Clostridiales bacterium]|nr:murein biosynthesis integral membrane protein MurJ [Clostridiales bacterium]